jgi:hypothetical protein
VNDSLIIAREIPHGFTWTLASRLGDMLTYAEAMYGPRNQEYTILGIEFCDSGPRIWYPKSKNNIIVQLSFDALESETLALYQLAHESIHLLSPSGSSMANVLEEGLAVYFSWWYLEKSLGKDGKRVTNSDSYKAAGLLVEKVLRYNPDFFKSAPLRKFSEESIAELCPELTQEERAILVLPFEKFQTLMEPPSDLRIN